MSVSKKHPVYALVTGLVDEEIREQVLAQTVEKSLDETVKFIEAKETGCRSLAQLNSGGLASTGINKVTAYRREQRNASLPVTPTAVRNPETCKFCKGTGHGRNPTREQRRQKCPANGKIGHFPTSRICRAPEVRADSISEQGAREERAQFDANMSTVYLKQHVASLMDCKGNKYHL